MSGNVCGYIHKDSWNHVDTKIDPADHASSGHAVEQGLLARGMVVKSSSIIKLDPFLNDHQLTRVGVRLRRGWLLEHAIRPVILPKKERLFQLIIVHFHECQMFAFFCSWLKFDTL